MVIKGIECMTYIIATTVDVAGCEKWCTECEYFWKGNSLITSLWLDFNIRTIESSVYKRFSKKSA